MTVEQLHAGLERWGAELDNWPASQRAAAANLLALSPEAQALMDEATGIERLVRANDPARDLDPDAVRRVMDRVSGQLSRLPARRGLVAGIENWLAFLGEGPEWMPRFAAAMVVAAILGLAVGDSLVPSGARASGLEALAQVSAYYPLDVQ